MKKEELESKILIKQNQQMSSKLHIYRRENQQLKLKNEELNLWVQNLSQVFAGISAAWENILSLQESLYALMRKKSDTKDKTVLSKYIAHFKVFTDIIQNLGQKIKNPGHSDQAALDAKTRLTSFVKNYQLFFKQFVDTYFKFNQQYTQWLSDLQKKSDLQQNLRSIMNKQFQNRQKIKDFEMFMNGQKDQFKVYESFNQHQLLDGIIAKKQKEVAQLKLGNERISRKLKMIMEYNTQSIDKLIQSFDDDSYFQCYCGGVQIKYYKRAWEQNLKNFVLKGKSYSSLDGNGSQIIQEENKGNKEQLQLLQKQKVRLQERNSILLEKIQKQKICSKLTQDLVLKSSAYLKLKQQCQQLINYSNDLIGKLRKQSQYLFDIEKHREQQLKQLKKKYEKGPVRGTQTSQLDPNIAIKNNKPLQNFINDVQKTFTEFKTILLRLQERENNNFTVLTKGKTLSQTLKKNNEDLNRRINQYFESQSKKADKWEFRHQRYNEIEQKVQNLLKSNPDPQFQKLFKEFIMYVRGRDKKIKDLESFNRKRQREVTQKQAIIQIMKEEIQQTQKVFSINKEKIDGYEATMNKIQKDLSQLVEQNFNSKTEFQQEKNMLNLRFKAETQARNRLEETVKLLNARQAQIDQILKNSHETEKNYELWVKQKQQQIEKVYKDSQQKSSQIQLLKEQQNERDKTISKLCLEKQSMKSEISTLQMKFKNIAEKSEYEQIRREMMYYKNKVMCNCTGDRERQVVLKTCPHVFCKKCIEDTTSNRNRKCPLCATKFTKNDVHEIRLT